VKTPLVPISMEGLAGCRFCGKKKSLSIPQWRDDENSLRE